MLRINQKAVRPPDLGWGPCILLSPLGGHSKLGFTTSNASCLFLKYKYLYQPLGRGWVLYCWKISYCYSLVNACRLGHPICLIQDPNWWFRFIFVFPIHELINCSACSYLFLIAKAQPLWDVVVGQPTWNPPKSKLSPTLIKGSDWNPRGSLSCGIRARSSVIVLPNFLLPYLLSRNYKNRIELKFPKATLSLCCFLHSYCLLNFWLHCLSSCRFLLSNPLEFRVLMILVTIFATSSTPFIAATGSSTTFHTLHNQICRC
jgi:hypothetical protein